LRGNIVIEKSEWDLQTVTGSDYTIEWNGKPVQLGPHIRCNEARIYFYLDQQQRRVVVGHVGEHLRDKSTS